MSTFNTYDLEKTVREIVFERDELLFLLKEAMKDMKILYEAGRDESCVGIDFKWRYADRAEKIFKKNGDVK